MSAALDGICTCCGLAKQGKGRGVCVACAQAGAVKETPHSCTWCAARDWEKDMAERALKPAPTPLPARGSLLLGRGGS